MHKIKYFYSINCGITYFYLFIEDTGNLSVLVICIYKYANSVFNRNNRTVYILKIKTKEYKHRPLILALLSILFGILLLLGCTLFVLADWYKNTYNISFEELLFTIMSPMKGTGKGTIDQILKVVVPPMNMTISLNLE